MVISLTILLSYLMILLIKKIGDSEKVARLSTERLIRSNVL